jgi:hypothetical protein
VEIFSCQLLGSTEFSKRAWAGDSIESSKEGLRNWLGFYLDLVEYEAEGFVRRLFGGEK